MVEAISVMLKWLSCIGIVCIILISVLFFLKNVRGESAVAKNVCMFLTLMFGVAGVIVGLGFGYMICKLLEVIVTKLLPAKLTKLLWVLFIMVDGVVAFFVIGGAIL